MRTARDAAKMEKLGKPTAFLVAKGFESDARFNAKMEGVPDLCVVALPVSSVPRAEETKELRLGELAAEGVIAGLSQRLTPSAVVAERIEETFTFSGEDYTEAVENMEKYFLQNCWSDGAPLVPPTEKAVNRMLEGTTLRREHVVGVVEPGYGKATVEKIAINAVMAGCLPQYMPVIIAAVEAIVEPRFYLAGVLCTAGPVSPLLVVSGPKLIDQLNINDSFSTIGPGWRANTTIGRAIRLIMTNIGYSWPGRNDMKSIGNPFKFVTVMAENESGYGGAWEPIRVAEGFGYDQPTVSVARAVSFQPHLTGIAMRTTGELIETLAAQGKVKYNNLPHWWGADDLVLLSLDAFRPILNEGLSRADVQKRLYEAIELSGSDYLKGREPSRDGTLLARGIPEWILQKCRETPEAKVPLLRGPESLKIVVTGAGGPPVATYVCSWGTKEGNLASFVTKAISLPNNWSDLLQRHSGWETPIVR